MKIKVERLNYVKASRFYVEVFYPLKRVNQFYYCMTVSMDFNGDVVSHLSFTTKNEYTYDYEETKISKTLANKIFIRELFTNYDDFAKELAKYR